MNEKKDLKNSENNDPQVCNARRAFLRDGALAVAGTLAMGVAGRAEETKTETKVETGPVAADLVLKLKENQALAKVGGSQVVDVGADKVIIARNEESSFVACSAKCPHKGALLEYSHETKEFFCPLHNSRFSLDGKIVRGPAKQPLTSYGTDTAAVVSLKPKA